MFEMHKILLLTPREKILEHLWLVSELEFVVNSIDPMERSAISSGIRLPPIYCPKGNDHEGELVTSICLEPRCAQALCCSVCLTEHHSHRSQPIKIRLRNAQESMSGLRGKDTDSSMLMDTVIESKRDMKASVQAFHRRVIDSIQQLESLIDMNFGLVEERMRMLRNFSQELSKEIESIKSIEHLKKLMTDINTFSNMAKPSGNDSYELIAKRLLEQKQSFLHLITKSTEEWYSTWQRISDSLKRLSNMEEPKKSKKKALFCENNHILYETVNLPAQYTDNEFGCDICGVMEQASVGNEVMHCRICDYDLCKACCQKKYWQP